MRPTITAEDATRRVGARLGEAAARLPPGARLEVAHRADDLPCDAPTDDGPGNRVMVEHRYWIRGLPSDDHHRCFDLLRRHWDALGYRRLREHRRDRCRELVYTDPEGFRLRLATSADGTHLSIRAQSPCVWRHGTPGSDEAVTPHRGGAVTPGSDGAGASRG